MLQLLPAQFCSPPVAWNLSRLTLRTPARRTQILRAALLLLLTLPATVSAADKKVLFLNTDKSNGMMIAYREAIQSAIRAGSPDRVTFYEEYMDLWQYSGDDYLLLLRDFYRQKYRGQKFDLIITQAPTALSFLLKYGDELFPDTPTVFGTLDKSRIEGLNLGPNITGILSDYRFGTTLEAALRLQPDVRSVVVVAGTSPGDVKYLAKARTEFRNFEGRVEFVYLTDLPMAELESRLAKLPEHTITFYVSLYRDGAGQPFVHMDSVARVTKASSAPTYSVVDRFIELGSIGGFVFSLEADAREVAQVALRVLAGEKPADIPIRVADTNRYMFDWRQLRRWKIDERRLPPGSVLLFRQLTFWELYKWRIVAVVSLCVVQALLIVWLLITRNRRRRAEEAKESLAAIVESSDDAILSKTLDGTITSWNGGAEKMYGYSAGEMIGRPVSSLIPAELKEELPEILERIRHGESLDHLETVRVTKDGRRIDVSLTISAIKDDHGVITGASTVARDITRRKQAMENLRESEERFRMMADTAPIMVWASGPDTLCTFFNRPWLQFTGRTMAEELGNGWAEGVHPEDYQRCLDVYLSAFEARRNFTMEYRLRRADGQYRWVLDEGVPRLLPNGELAGYIGCCLDITERRQSEQALQQLTGRLLMLQDEERQRVAAELHDGLGQNLAIIKNRAMIGLRDETNQERAREQLEEIASTAAASIVEVREIAHNLRPYELDRLGLVAAIESMIERVSDSTAIKLSANLERIEGLLSPEAETSVYRIVQEGLNNVIKHSNATAARIEIKKIGNRLAITVEDNGAGMPAHVTAANGNSGNNGKGFGLVGIAERVRVLGGSLAIDSRPARGTAIKIGLELTNGAGK
jgi:PAS domain S-box-containing protein